jgi:hypothetical protein
MWFELRILGLVDRGYTSWAMSPALSALGILAFKPGAAWSVILTFVSWVNDYCFQIFKNGKL